METIARDIPYRKLNAKHDDKSHKVHAFLISHLKFCDNNNNNKRSQYALSEFYSWRIHDGFAFQQYCPHKGAFGRVSFPTSIYSKWLRLAFNSRNFHLANIRTRCLSETICDRYTNMFCYSSQFWQWLRAVWSGSDRCRRNITNCMQKFIFIIVKQLFVIRANNYWCF